MVSDFPIILWFSQSLNQCLTFCLIIQFLVLIVKNDKIFLRICGYMGVENKSMLEIIQSLRSCIL